MLWYHSAEPFVPAVPSYCYAPVDNGYAILTDYYRLYHMLNLVSKDALAPHFIHSSLKQLREYDQEKGSEYMATIRVYLDCNQNMSETAQKLCIHKNTVFYRLGRLKSDFGIDLQDTRMLVTIYCSLKLSEMI